MPRSLQVQLVDIVLQVGSSDNANFAPIVSALSNVDNKGGNQFWENIKQENNT